MDRGAWRATVPGIAESNRTTYVYTHIPLPLFKFIAGFSF